MKIILSIIIALILINTGISQERIVATGNDFGNFNGSVSFSIGLIDYYTSNDSLIKSKFGLQIPIEIYINTTDYYIKVEDNISIYPNPIKDFVNLSIKKDFINLLKYEINNNNLQKIIEHRIYEEITQINFSDLPDGIYFLRIMNQSKQIAFFKIIKIK